MPNAPKFDPARRNASVGPVQLPAEGRKGRTPAWPLPGRMRAGELQLWRSLWRTPQAVQWERLGWTRVVARYCRTVRAAEENPTQQSVMSEARQLEDRLGLTPKAMRLMLWTIVGDAVAERREARERQQRKGAGDARQRIKAVDS